MTSAILLFLSLELSPATTQPPSYKPPIENYKPPIETAQTAEDDLGPGPPDVGPGPPEADDCVDPVWASDGLDPALLDLDGDGCVDPEWISPGPPESR